MKYSFNAAQKLIENDIRPRLYFGPDDVAAIHSGLKSSDGRKLWKRFVERSGDLVELALTVEDMPFELSRWCRAWNLPGTKIVFGAPDIGALAALTGDERAIEACRRIITSLIKAEELVVKEFGKDAYGSRHRVGYMAGFYMAPLYDMAAQFLTSAERSLFCQWAMRFVIKHNVDLLSPKLYFGPGGNINFVGLNGALMTALVLQGDKLVKVDQRLIDSLLGMMEAAIGGCIAPSGYPLEDIGYGTAVVANMSYTIETARRLGVADFAARYPRYNKFGRAMIHFVQPWGEHLSNTGDHGDDFKRRDFILPRLAEETHDPTLLWLWQTLSYNHGAIHPMNSDQTLYGEAALGKGRQVPATINSLVAAPLLAKAQRPTAATVPIAFCCRRRGLVSFRSGWRNDDLLLVFDGSSRSDGAQGHHHDSSGHFSLSAVGEYFSIDTGRYNVTRTCHSVVLVNGESTPDRDSWSQTLHEGRLTEYAPHQFVDSAAADATAQYGGAVRKAERRVGLVKGAGARPYVWVQDAINANDKWATFDWQMQCAPESKVKVHKRGGVVTGFQHGNLLGVDLFVPLFPGKRNDPAAHKVDSAFCDMAHPNAVTYLDIDTQEKIDQKVAEFSRPAAMIHGPVHERPRLVVRYEGWNGRSLAVLIPRLKGEAAPKLKQIEAVPGAIAVEIAFAKVTDTLIVSYDHPVLKAGEVDERGGWCVIRRSNETGKVIRRIVGEEVL